MNPDHLWLGTKEDNNRDRDQKGRSRFVGYPAGTQLKFASDDQVREIRRRYDSGESPKRLSKGT